MRESGGVRYRCKTCRHHFSDISGTIFEVTRTPLSKWLLAIGLWKHGISASALQDTLGVTYKTAWVMLQAMRRAVSSDRFFGKLRGEVEVDETYYGGRRKGRRGRGAAGKTPVVGLRQRNGRVKTVVVPDLDAHTLRSIIRRYVRKGSTIYTDSLHSYTGLEEEGYHHAPVNHTETFIRWPNIHTQTIESQWAHTKPDVMARHHSISPTMLPEYLSENDFRFNERHNPDFIRAVVKKLVTFYPRRG
jgi:transposase